MGLLRFAIKSSIAGGLVYYTVQEGLWSSSEDSGKFYNKLYNKISPLIKKNIPEDVIQEIHHIPNPSDLKTYTTLYWNKGVVISIKFLSELPLHVSNGIEKIQKEIEKNIAASGESVAITVTK
ncbi:MICOS complex subunit MIC13-like [Phymastichus coffea]|uniref:MICOS complex subunit MIC13-like n=1 Tax=Phymastichus coffea TaxID=108790 RepID=UPI00273B7DD8|nr:MICOS complex subunit MIC13-like [Phymastichus coffea]